MFSVQITTIAEALFHIMLVSLQKDSLISLQYREIGKTGKILKIDYGFRHCDFMAANVKNCEFTSKDYPAARYHKAVRQINAASQV